MCERLRQGLMEPTQIVLNVAENVLELMIFLPLPS